MRGYVGPDDGYMARMLRILSAAALLVVVAAGCGDAAPPQRVGFHGVPRSLAQDWEGRATAIATAASNGNGCRALRLANSLRTDVIAKQYRLPLRLRAPLLTGVSSLAGRITCTPVATTPEKPKPPQEPKPKPKPPKHPKPPGHDKGDDR
jgi:hypothetical protein